MGITRSNWGHANIAGVLVGRKLGLRESQAERCATRGREGSDVPTSQGRQACWPPWKLGVENGSILPQSPQEGLTL